MKDNGFDAVEIGDPGSIDAAKNWKKKADGAGLVIASIYYGGAEHPLMSEDPAERQKGLDQSKAKMEIAAAMNCPVLVYVPVRGSQPDTVKNLPERVLWQRTVAVLKDIGPMAAALNTNVILEPLRRGEAWFMRQVSQATKLAQEANVPGIAVLGDTYHMYTEEASSMAAFIAAGDYLKHVHLGSGQGRVLPTAENHSAKGHTHTEAFRGLKYVGYTGVVSFECGIGGSNDKAVEVPKCLDYLRKCWEEA
jgi:D-psicose/D-tagatose/L-ribulose 3-epimerase